MSDAADKLRDILGDEVNTALVELTETMPDKLIQGIKGYVADAPPVVLERMRGALARAAKFKALALTAPTVEERRDAAAAVETALRSFQTIVEGEALVASETVAALITEYARGALSVVGDLVPRIVGGFATGVAKGLAEGLLGGDGSSDPFR